MMMQNTGLGNLITELYTLQKLYEVWDGQLMEPRWTDPHPENVKKEHDEVHGARLLAMAASRPALAPGAATELSALVAPGDFGADAIEYRWSWCPFTTGLAPGTTVYFEPATSLTIKSVRPGVTISLPLDALNCSCRLTRFVAFTREVIVTGAVC